MKNKVSVCVVGLLTVIALIFALLSVSVYGRLDIVQALRSEFMKNIVVPVLVPIIGFSGVAFSVYIGSKHNQEKLTKTLEQNHLHKMQEIQMENKNATHQRLLLSQELIAKARLDWLREVRQTYRKYLESANKIRSLFLKNSFVRTTELTNDSPNFQDIQMDTDMEIQNFVGLSDVLISYFNPNESAQKDRQIISKIDLFKEVADQTHCEVSNHVNAAFEKNKKTDNPIVDYHIFENPKELLSCFDVQLIYIKDEITAYIKDEWQAIKKELS